MASTVVPSSSENPANSSEKEYGKVVLTLTNVLLPPDKFSPTPSFIDGLDAKCEEELRILGCELIQTSGILLKLPQVAMATGQVLFQRFYFSKSFINHNMEIVAMACINLASKIEEAPRRIRDVLNVFHHIKQMRNQKEITPLVLDSAYIEKKSALIKSERRILKELGFCCYVKHPHKAIVMILRDLDLNTNKELVQCSWNYMNDSFRTNLFVSYCPEAIACACIYLAARQLQVPLPNNPPWFICYGQKEQDLQAICMVILLLYTCKRPQQENLDSIVTTLKIQQKEAKAKARGINLSNHGTPNSTSRDGTPSKANNSPTNSKKGRSDDIREHRRRRSCSPSSSSSGKRSNSESPGYRSHRHHSKHHRGSKHKRSDGGKYRRSRSRSSSPIKRKKHRAEHAYMHDRVKHSSHDHVRSRDKHRNKKHNGHRRSRSPHDRHRH